MCLECTPLNRYTLDPLQRTGRHIYTPTSKMPMRCTHQDAFVWVVYLVGEKDERGNALFANAERGVGILCKIAIVSFLSIEYKLDDLYCRMAGTPSSPTPFYIRVEILARCPCIARNIKMHFFTKHLLWLTHAGVIPFVKTNDILRILSEKWYLDHFI